jgi:ligand-binding sensor domain-containing protein
MLNEDLNLKINMLITLFFPKYGSFRAYIHLIFISLFVFIISCKEDPDDNDSGILQNSGFIETSYNSVNNIRVNSIMRDVSGYKWFGTVNGLFVYNNSKWYQYSEFSGLNIYSIAINDNEIALGTSKGAYSMTIEDNKIALSDSVFGNITGSRSDTIFSFGYDMFNNKWAGVPDGLTYYDGTTWKMNQEIRNNLGGIWDVRSMAFRYNDCFFCTYGTFLFHIKFGKIGTVDGVTGASKMMGGAEDPVNNFNGELTTDTIYSVFAGSDSSIWFGSKTGLTRNKGATNVNTGFFEYFLRGQKVHCILETSGKKLMAGTENGLYLRNGEDWINYNSSDGLSGNLINCLAEDADLSIWIGTNNGISHFVNGTFVPVE